VYKDFSGLEVLFGINLGIREGDRHAIIGPNGAGKTTIFNLITGKYLPSRGNIFFQSQDITGASPFKLNRQGMSRSFQITNIFKTMSVFQNVRLAVLSQRRILYNLFSGLDRMEKVNRQTENVLKEIGLFERKDVVAGLLSYGEQRALRMTRLLLKNYKRLAFINTGQYEIDHYRSYARSTAQAFELRFEEIEGSPALVEKMVHGPWDDEFVVIAPGETVRYTHFAASKP
jgi:ABC-type branched-subunit amino acid transport system ATPase component